MSWALLLAVKSALHEYLESIFLYLFNPCKHNKVYSEIYERLVDKGNSEKLAFIAVVNELLRQAFAIAKSGRPYDQKFVSVLKK